MMFTDYKTIEELNLADLERASAYAKDLSDGLKIVRTFPQGVTFLVRPVCPKPTNTAKKLAN